MRNVLNTMTHVGCAAACWLSISLTIFAAEPAVPALERRAADGRNQLTDAEREAGWIQLFDGHTLFGWRATSKSPWEVRDGVIVSEPGDKGLLITTSRFADYELRCEFRCAVGGNSGIFLRTVPEPTDPGVDCYELNICDTHPQFASASLVKRAKPARTCPVDGAWHAYRVNVQGPKVSVQLDGEPVLDYVDQTPKPLTAGHIGLQMNAGKVEFKNIYLRPLNTSPINDWHVVPGSQITWEKNARGEIQLSGGRGFLESPELPANFVLQFAARTQAAGLNSGVFFRAMPGTEAAPSNGYEFQIHNGFKDGDRNRPADSGTGAIFRRAAARRVVADDEVWVTGTLVADGPHFATWVNGLAVVDWTDTRSPNENPREGLRLKGGHVSLQGHDPSTRIQFRNIHFAPLPE